MASDNRKPNQDKERTMATAQESDTCFILENKLGDYLQSFDLLSSARETAIRMANETGETFKVIRRTETNFESQYTDIGVYSPGKVVEC